MSDFLHARSDFNELLAIVAEQHGIDPVLVDKDYWIMHCLWGLQASKFRFELKGGTSLSKGFGIIHRFSEDIDIRIEPPDTGIHQVPAPEAGRIIPGERHAPLLRHLLSADLTRNSGVYWHSGLRGAQAAAVSERG
jgi:Nucleotidyl transferase AbiEii toxin, Type IV TA system